MALRRPSSPSLSTRCPEGTSVAGRDVARIVLDGMALDFPQRAASSSEQIEPWCLEQACIHTMREFYWQVSIFARHYQVPGDILLDILVHWIVSDHMGWDRSPPHLFIVEKEP